MKFAPVILFANNRPNHIKRTIESLLLNAFCVNDLLKIGNRHLTSY
jgi:hypothetical protein